MCDTCYPQGGRVVPLMPITYSTSANGWQAHCWQAHCRRIAAERTAAEARAKNAEDEVARLRAKVAMIEALAVPRRIAAMKIIGSKGQRRHPDTRAWFASLAHALAEFVDPDRHPADDEWLRPFFRAVGRNAELNPGAEHETPDPTDPTELRIRPFDRVSYIETEENQ